MNLNRSKILSKINHLALTTVAFAIVVNFVNIALNSSSTGSTIINLFLAGYFMRMFSSNYDKFWSKENKEKLDE